MKKFWSSVWEIAEVVIISVAVVFVIRHYLVQPFLVSGASMEPNFSDGNYLIVDELTYRFRDPARYETIVHRYPKNPSTYFIKRIIGLPGERIVIQNGSVKVFQEGQEIALEESYLPANRQTPGDVKITLKDGEYFVMGDNRFNSLDSRNWGPLPREDIVGIARFRVLPISKFGIISQPAQ